MKGKILRIMKKWWIVALVLTLALSLTSCSSKKNRGLLSGGQGFSHTPCDGTLGSFDVFVVAQQGNPGLYTISVIPVQPAQPGDLLRFAIVNDQQPDVHRPLSGSHAAFQGVELFGGTISEADFALYDRFDIRLDEPNTTFFGGQFPDDAVCALVPPGTALGNGTF